jgi:hypothetical protein
MPEAITIKQDPTPAFSTEDQAQLNPDDKIELQGEEPRLLAGKYKSPEDLERAYKELESKLGQSKPEAPEAEEVEATDDEVEQVEAEAGDAKEIYGDYIGSRLEEAGIDFGDMNTRWQQTGELSEADYGELEGAGFTRQMVDAYLAGLQYTATQDNELAAQQITSIKSQYGGEEGYAAMTQWAAENLSESEISAFNKLVNTNDPDQARLAVAGLYSQYTNANGREPKLLGGRAPKAGGDKFESTAQVVEAMSDPKYQADPAFRRKVQEKLARSNVL